MSTPIPQKDEFVKQALREQEEEIVQRVERTTGSVLAALKNVVKREGGMPQTVEITLSDFPYNHAGYRETGLRICAALEEKAFGKVHLATRGQITSALVFRQEVKEETASE